MSPSTSFDHIYSLCRKAFHNSPEVRHVSKIKLNQAALDVTIVAAGVRSGYLVDTLTLRNTKKRLKDFIGELLGRLRQQCDIFKSITTLYDSASDQLFIINVLKLRTYCDPTHDALSPALLTWVTFLELDGSKAEVSPPPPGLPGIFRDTLKLLKPPNDLESPLLVHLPETDTRTLGDMVALAACLLEFPVAYAPSGDGSHPFLAGVPLDVYECVLVQDSHPPLEHVMLKFSCPRTVAAGALDLQPEALVERLRTRFTERLKQVAFLGMLVVRYHVETKDRVAL
ncbi:hypothetical protein V8D89_012881 [Ganoderma adspersum]